MIDSRRQASGFPCPGCGQDRLATIVSHDTTHIIELQCVDPECAYVWGVEA